MTAGRTKGIYTADDGASTFYMEVPNNLFAEGGLGWTGPAAGSTYDRLPRRLKPRKVWGVGTNGKRYSAICATNASTLYTGTTSSWTSVENDGTTMTVTRTGRVGERFNQLITPP